ncbi:MAG: hypothetical protein HY076_03930 [Candidatus Eisenbacteria bacterium]|uniref:Uncharacterized protein n=1 Tax=Eiseniibacteriota bacterium TaxID=2212470 RepID=A0A9D6L7Q8_UNCEI|nr:hypothetical protein [Candidatus Eisenbacteria bacterium]MBI3539404.1 hypothetical protein [Candidatus Eisenbacteria bacterium]
MRITRVVLGCAALMMVAGLALAGAETAGEKKADMKGDMKTPMKGDKMGAAKHAMSMYMIESPHTEAECLGVMDATSAAKELDKWEWGCMAGNHTAYRMVQAADENAALAMVPENVRAKAKAYKLTKMTAAMLEKAHQAH